MKPPKFKPGQKVKDAFHKVYEIRYVTAYLSSYIYKMTNNACILEKELTLAEPEPII